MLIIDSQILGAPSDNSDNCNNYLVQFIMDNITPEKIENLLISLCCVDDNDAILFKAKLFSKKKDYDNALLCFDFAIDQKGSARTYIEKAKCFLDTYRYVESKEVCEQGLEIYSNNFELICIYAKSHIMNSEFEVGHLFDNLQ